MVMMQPFLLNLIFYGGTQILKQTRLRQKSQIFFSCINFRDRANSINLSLV